MTQQFPVNQPIELGITEEEALSSSLPIAQKLPRLKKRALAKGERELSRIISPLLDKYLDYVKNNQNKEDQTAYLEACDRVYVDWLRERPQYKFLHFKSEFKQKVVVMLTRLIQLLKT